MPPGEVGEGRGSCQGEKAGSLKMRVSCFHPDCIASSDSLGW